MGKTEVDLLLEGYDALNRGDLSVVLGLLDQKIEWQEPTPSPEAGAHSGRESFARFMTGWIDSFEDFRIEPERVTERGDRLIVTVRQSGRGRGSGIAIEARLAHVWTIRDGQAIAWRSYADPAEAEADSRIEDPPEEASADQAHWQNVYNHKDPSQVSWYESVPEVSLSLIAAAGLSPDAAILDVGGGVSYLAAELIKAGYRDVTVVDISRAALKMASAEFGGEGQVEWIEADIRAHDFDRHYDLWHDRAVFHFMVEPVDRDAYLDTVSRTLRPGGHLILATFGPEGPTTCSGLPIHRYGAEQLAESLGDEFELLRSEICLHRTPSGSSQQFLHAGFRRRKPSTITPS